MDKEQHMRNMEEGEGKKRRREKGGHGGDDVEGECKGRWMKLTLIAS
jgi:hypothetical protein